ncbi:ATP-binding cassette domain-containing protein [Terrilactibacillus sp. BCM23-1]|uniref:ATP-binding cassette domain-containing protein n=1 Tax=Terrilactibacillus tamarindi TaxID=2599694 RepID=A0A6N8CML4_9BACI|nr:ABC transporter ATP-binding protein [Terrilactibacillus tamarindi]MTT30868.1 ATP-binding cassette domain-containing protein [Terrilactibacillus tamarindi]
MIIQLSGHHLTKKFKQQTILSDVNLSLASGEIYGLLGPSGSGKTTLVKILLGLEKCDQGKVELFNQKPSISSFRHLGYMAQSDALYEELTAYENLDFFGSIQGLRKKERKQRIEEVAEIVHLRNDLSKKVLQYSGGMKRRLSLACALIHKPKLYLLDEPTVGLDPLLRQSIWKLFQKLKEDEATLIVTTHVMDEVNRCDRVGLLKDGKILATGSPADLLKTYQVDSIEDIFLKGVSH